MAICDLSMTFVMTFKQRSFSCFLAEKERRPQTSPFRKLKNDDIFSGLFAKTELIAFAKLKIFSILFSYIF